MSQGKAPDGSVDDDSDKIESKDVGSIDPCGLHPALTKIYKKNNPLSIGQAIVLLVLFAYCFANPLALIITTVLAVVYGLGALGKLKTIARLRRLSELLLSNQQEKTTAKLSLEKALLLFKKHSGVLLEETRLTSPHQRISFDEPDKQTGELFDSLVPIDVGVVADPDSQKVLALTTEKGILLADHSIGSRMGVWGQALTVITITIVMVPIGCVSGFIATSGILKPLPRTIPEGQSAEEYLRLGKRYKGAGWTELSRRALDRAIEMDLGNIGKQAAHYKKTRLPHIPVPDRLVKKNILAFNESAINPKHAEELWKNCIESYPEFEWPYSNLASMYIGQNRLEEAEQLLNKAIQLNPNYTNALIHMAELKIAQKNKPAALEYVNKALELEPDDTNARELKKSLEKG